MEIGHEIISTAILSLPLIMKGSCQLLAKECALSTEVRSRMRALDRARDGIKIVLLNDSERSLSIFVLLASYIGSVLFRASAFTSVRAHIDAGN